MWAKLNQYYNSCKLVVEDYKINSKMQKFICSCYTPEVPEDIEPEYLIREITLEDLKVHVADARGNIWVTDINDAQKGYDMPFLDWITEAEKEDICKQLAEIINIKELRFCEWDDTCDTMHQLDKSNQQILQLLKAS